jgi:hypothetical protein
MNNPIPAKAGMSSLVRAKFGPGMLLQHDDLELVSAYTRDLSRLLFRSLFGCGVVCGLKVTVIPTETGAIDIKIHPGVALDKKGDPIEVSSEETFTIHPRCLDRPTDPMWVVLDGTTKCCGPRMSLCDSDDDEPVSAFTKVRYGYEIRLETSKPAECDCQCNPDKYGEVLAGNCLCANPESPCYQDHYDGVCPNGCRDNCDCRCDGVVLARIEFQKEDPQKSGWVANHRARRFIRPMLMSDPETRPLPATQPPEQEGGDGGDGGDEPEHGEGAQTSATRSVAAQSSTRTKTKNGKHSSGSH